MLRAISSLLLKILLPACLVLTLSGALHAEMPQAVMPEKHLALFKENCVSCHNSEKQKGHFRVDDLPFSITTVEAAEKWQKVLNAMNSGDMPPEDETQPDKTAKADFLDDLAHVMVAARRTLGDQNGVITMRRLNRREYRNTLRELLGVEVNVSELPSDGGSGFDTVGVNLFMSGNQFEQYQSLGREALTEAFAWHAAAKEERKMRYEAETFTPVIEKFVAHQIDARDRAQRWVKAVDEAAAKPENAEIVAQVRKTVKNDTLFRREWEKIPGAPSPRSFGFDKKGENDADLANDSLRAGWLEYHQYYLRQPAVDRGAYLGIETRHPSELNPKSVNVLVPFNWPVGNYIVRVRAGLAKDAPADRRFIDFGINARQGPVLATREITGTIENPQIVEFPLTMTRGNADHDTRTIYFREKGAWDTNEEGGRRRSAAVARNGIGPELVIWVDWVEVERVPDKDEQVPPAIAALEGITMDDKLPPPTTPVLRAALEKFATEAFRGVKPVAAFLDRLVGLYEGQRKMGVKPVAALKETLAVVMASPMFLYLAEPSTDGKQRALTAPELAGRLSYFLWSAPPDLALRELAKSGELLKPEVLAAQTERLLDDPRAESFVRAFVQQWLGMDRFDFFEVNRAAYPRFDNGTKLSAKEEVFATFAYQLQHNASLRDLLKSGYVVIDRVLANFYGLDGVQGQGFEKVMLPADSPRGGLLGMAAIHFMGSNGERTSPVERGAWVLRKLLNDPPPPAPANVPALTRLAGKVLTTRERLLAHQEDPQCASCHRKIDPVGYALENFDAAGQWRTEDSYQATDKNGKPDPKTKKTWIIEAAATMHKGPEFHDFQEFRDIVAARSDDFARGFSEALFEYALGRPIGFRDEPVIAGMVRQAQRKDYALREFIQAVVRSTEFHTK